MHFFDKLLNKHSFIDGLSVYSSTDVIKKQLKHLCKAYLKSEVAAITDEIINETFPINQSTLYSNPKNIKNNPILIKYPNPFQLSNAQMLKRCYTYLRYYGF